MTTPGAYPLTLQDGTHVTCLDEGLLPADQLLGAAHHAHVRMTTTAFFDAQLKGDAAAKAWLADRSIEEVSLGWCALELR